MFRKQKGAATLIIAVVMLLVITLIILFSANYNLFQEKVTSNSNVNNQAYEAAEAGLEFGIVYLQQNSAAILANPVNGYIPAYSSSNTQNVTLADGSKFSIAYSNPIQNNYTIILIKSTGTNSDGTSTRIVQQKVANGSLLTSPPTIPLVTKGSVSMSGSSLISNPTGSSTISSGSSISFSGASQTLDSGVVGSNSAHTGSDIQQNNSTIANMSNTTFFETYFGSPEAAVQGSMAHTYTNSSSTNYSATLNGMTGTSIWINQTGGQASINGSVTIGSPTSPVLLIVNGNLTITGGATIYGLVYVIGGVATGLTGSSVIIGGMVSTDNLNLSGSTSLTFSSTVLSALQQQAGLSYYAKVPGTWRDF